MKRVVIAEDETALLEMFVDVVQDLGHTVFPAHDGDQALELARRHHPDLIISDQMMPGRSGLELLAALREDPTLSQTSFILMSAASPEGRERADAFLSKPVDLDRFESAVRAALQMHQPASEAERNAVTPDEDVSSLTVAREELLTWVAHEIKTPLSAAKLSVQLMQRENSLDARATTRVGSLVRQLDRINTLIESVLEASRLASGRIELRKERRDLQHFVVGLVDDWRERHPDYQFSCKKPVGTMLADFDPERLRQVLDNFCSNAVKYGLPSKRIDIIIERSRRGAEVNVVDFGAGISAGELPHIFKRFHRAQNAQGQGHGLGLFIASTLARMHGGGLEAKSSPPNGSTFTLHLPLPA